MDTDKKYPIGEERTGYSAFDLIMGSIPAIYLGTGPYIHDSESVFSP